MATQVDGSDQWGGILFTARYVYEINPRIGGLPTQFWLASGVGMVGLCQYHSRESLLKFWIEHFDRDAEHDLWSLSYADPDHYEFMQLADVFPITKASLIEKIWKDKGV